VTMPDIWREIDDDDEQDVWQALWEDATGPLVADFQSEYMPFESAQARIIGRFGVVRVARVEYGQQRVTFWVTRKSGDDSILWQKARNEWSDLETIHEDEWYESRHHCQIYLPREAGGVSEWR